VKQGYAVNERPAEWRAAKAKLREDMVAPGLQHFIGDGTLCPVLELQKYASAQVVEDGPLLCGQPLRLDLIAVAGERQPRRDVQVPAV
jgi:hypothetical protein